MIDTEVQDTYSEIIERIRQLSNKLSKIKQHTFYEDESFSDAIKSLAQDYDSYFLEGDDTLLLKKEVSKNIRTINIPINRDGTEFNYIKELDSLFSEIDSINKTIQLKSWTDYFKEEYKDTNREKVSLGAIEQLLDSIRECCKMLALSRHNATEVLFSSLFVQERPEQFPAISSLNNNGQSATKNPVIANSNPSRPVEFRHTDYLLSSLHLCLFGELPDEDLITKEAIYAYMDKDGKDHIWSSLVGHEISYGEQFINFEEEIKSNFLTFQNNETRAIQLANVLRDKVDKLIKESNRFVEKVSILWGTSTHEVLKWVDVPPDFFIKDLTIRDRNGNTKPYDFDHPEYKFADYIGLVIAAINQTVSFCQNYLRLYAQSPTKSTIQEPEPTETGVKKPWKDLPPKVLLLDKLGFFKLTEVEKMSNESKGKLVSILCGGSADNAVDYIRECDPSRLALGKNPYRNLKNVDAVNELLALLNRE